MCYGEEAGGVGRSCGARGATCDQELDCLRDTDLCASAGQSVCDGSVAVSCWAEGLAIPGGVDCARVPGFECVNGACAALSADCDATASARCDGDTLSFCFEGSTRSVDCASVGGRCEDNGVASCVAR
jgi:hypothetical protein